MRKSLILAALLLLCCAGLSASAQVPATQGAVSEEKARAIRHLLELTKAGDLGVQVVSQTLPQVRASLSLLPPETLEKVMRVYEEEMQKDFSKEMMIESAIPIYDKYLTLDEINQLTAFYETPIGQKLVAVNPLIVREAFDDGVRRGRLTGQRVLERLRKEGILHAPLAEPAQPTPVPARRIPPTQPRSRRRG